VGVGVCVVTASLVGHQRGAELPFHSGSPQSLARAQARAQSQLRRPEQLAGAVCHWLFVAKVVVHTESDKA